MNGSPWKSICEGSVLLPAAGVATGEAEASGVSDGAGVAVGSGVAAGFSPLPSSLPGSVVSMSGF